jgi:sterol desaturase/sphingolipid hydroxylase (fatty acid hydroxylase superfamily)
MSIMEPKVGSRAAEALLVVQAAFTVVVGLALLGYGTRHPGRGYGVAGLFFFLLAAIVVGIAIGVGRGRYWARSGAVAIEVLLALGSLSRIKTRPVAAVIALILEASTVVLLARRPRNDRPGPPPPPSPPPPPLPPVAPVQVVQTAAATRRGLSAGQVLISLATLAVFLVALAVRSGIVFGMVVVAAIFIPIERVWALHPQKVLRKGWATDVVHFVVNNFLTTIGLFVAVVAVGSALHAVVPAALHGAVGRQPGLVQFAEAFLLTELCFYAAHRATHTVPLLWRFHKVHHTITEMDWLASAHLHPIDQTFTRSCSVIPLYALGFSRATFGAFLVFTTLQALFIHANVRLTFGPLRWVVATPEFHHWHHANDPEHYNTNFAGQFPWVDALFGTLYLPKHQWPARYGIDAAPPAGYLRQLAWPFHVAG